MPIIQVNEILLRIKKVFEMLDYEVLRCDCEIKSRDAIIKANSGLERIKYKRKVINAKIEREKFQIARQSYIELAEDMRQKIDYTISKSNPRDRELITCFLTHSWTINEVATNMHRRARDVAIALDAFSRSLAKRLKYIQFNKYFDI